jgi:hypothetical protein
MNSKKTGFCYTNGGGYINFYNIGCDAKGNNEITGEGGEIHGNEKYFCCIGLEVFKVTF